MLEDLKAVARLTDEQINKLCQRLSTAKGFLNPQSLRIAISEVVDDDAIAGSIQRILRNLGFNDVKRVLKSLSEKQQEDDFPLDDVTMSKVCQTLPKLVQPYPALSRFEKAERLAKLTGQQLETIELICDLRPIFDENRKRIEGMMPYTRLLVVATGADGLPISFEAELTCQDVHDLAEKVSKAKDKLDVLRESLEKWLPSGLPDLPLTRVPRKESSDA